MRLYTKGLRGGNGSHVLKDGVTDFRGFRSRFLRCFVFHSSEKRTTLKKVVRQSDNPIKIGGAYRNQTL